MRRSVQVLVVFLVVALTPMAWSADHACAHDVSGLCASPGDATTKSNYVFEPGEQPGVPGPVPSRAEGADEVVARQIGHVDPGGGFNADVVAHEDVAYLASWGANVQTAEGEYPYCPSQGVRAYDLSDPTNPTLVSTFGDAASEPDVFGSWTEKVIVRSVGGRDLAAVSFQSCRGPEGFRGFGLYDVTDPANPVRQSLVRTEDGSNGSHEIWLHVRDQRAWVYTAIILAELYTSPDGTTPGMPDFRVYDVSDPTSPVQVGEWGAWQELGIRPDAPDEQGTPRQRFVHSVRQDGDIAYLSYWDLGTVMLDMRDPANPVFLGRTRFAADEERNAHSSWTDHTGDLLVQTDEDFVPEPDPEGRIEPAWGYTRIFDISDMANPVELATFELPTTRQFPPPDPAFYSVHDPKIMRDTLYLSYYSEGVVVVDIADPAEPAFLAQFRPPATVDPRGFFGVPVGATDPEPIVSVWGVFPTDRYVLASDINSGLYVFRLEPA